MRTAPLPLMKMSFVAALTKSGFSSSSYSMKSSLEEVRCIDTPESSIRATILVGFALKLHMGQLICEAVQLQENLFKAFKSPLVICGTIAAYARGLALPGVRELVTYQSLGGDPVPCGFWSHSSIALSPQSKSLSPKETISLSLLRL